MSMPLLSQAADRDYRVFTAQTDISDLRPLIEGTLPDQGHIEVHRDVEGKEHAWRIPTLDETLIVLTGQLRCYWDAGEMIAGPGTVIALPAGVPYGLVALKGGATYLMAFDQMKLPLDG